MNKVVLSCSAATSNCTRILVVRNYTLLSRKLLTKNSLTKHHFQRYKNKKHGKEFLQGFYW